MYLMNAETEVLWELEPTVSPTPRVDYDIVHIDPLGLATYFDSPVQPADYVAPTATVPGSITHRVTPDKEGLWKVLLVTGTSTAYTLLDKVEMYVFDNRTVVDPIKNTPLGANSAIEVADETGVISSAATKIIFTGRGFTLTETAGIVTLSLLDFPVAPYQDPQSLLDALVGQIDTTELTNALTSRIDLVDGSGIGSVDSRIAVVDARVDTLNSTMTNPTNGLTANAIAISATKTKVDSIEGQMIAESGSVQQFMTDSGYSRATVDVQAASLNGLSAQYTVKVDVDGNVAGYGIASTLRGDTPFSEFKIVADKFTIAPVATDPNTGGSPFYYLTVDTLVDGILVPQGAYMKSAYIADATITNLKIGNVIESDGNGSSWRITKSGSIEGTSILIKDATGATVIDGGGNGTIYNQIADLQNQIDKNIATWFLNGIPTLFNSPYTSWVDNIERDAHLGDLYYDGMTQYAYRFKKVAAVYSWEVLSDSSVTAALAAAQAAQITADNKVLTYSQPTSPGTQASSKSDGDIWFKTDANNKLYRYTHGGAGDGWLAVNDDSADWAKIFDSGATKPSDNATQSYEADIATRWGFNPQFTDWTGAYPAGWGAWAQAPVKETSIVRIGTNAVKFTVVNTNAGMLKTYYLTVPSEIDDYITGSFDYYLSSYTSGGAGMLVDVGYVTSYQRLTINIPSTATGGWITVPFTAHVPVGEKITYIRIFMMGSYQGMVGGNLTGTIIFDSIALQLNHKVTAAQVTTGLQDGTTITKGGIVVSGGGSIHSNGKNSFASTTPGFFLGWDTTNSGYTFGVGNTSNYLQWNGTGLTISGSLTAGAGSVISGAHITDLTVSTLKIADNAVTLPVTVINNNSQSFPNLPYIGFSNTNTVEVSPETLNIASEGNPILINFSASVILRSGIGIVAYLKRTKNGVTTNIGVLFKSKPTTYGSTLTGSCSVLGFVSDTPGVGTVTYTLTCFLEAGNVALTYRTLVIQDITISALEVKK